MHKYRVVFIAVSALFIALWSAPGAEATMESIKVLKKAYPKAKASCVQCHTAKMGKGGDMNAYGEALVEYKGGVDAAKELTVEDLQAIENDDADGDGVSNKDELEGKTNPGDPEAGLRDAAQPLQRLLSALDRFLVPKAWAQEDEKEAMSMEQAEYVGSEMCMACHTEQAEEFEGTHHARISMEIEGLDLQGCEMCHGPGSLHVEAGGGKPMRRMIQPGGDPSACFQCHMDKRAEFSRPYRHPVMEDKMSCTDCHSPHGSEHKTWSAAMFDDINQDCASCHKEQSQPFVWEHEALQEGCVSCHNPHGSIHQKMLVVRDSNLCLRCHAQVDHPNIAGRDHTGFMSNGTCYSAGCHTAVHGSNFDDHLRY